MKLQSQTAKLPTPLKDMHILLSRSKGGPRIHLSPTLLCYENVTIVTSLAELRMQIPWAFLHKIRIASSSIYASECRAAQRPNRCAWTLPGASRHPEVLKWCLGGSAFLALAKTLNYLFSPSSFPGNLCESPMGNLFKGSQGS